MLNRMIIIFQKLVIMSYIELCLLKLCDVYNYDLLKFIRFAMSDRPKLFEEFYEPHLSRQNHHIRNSRFNLPPVRLDVERNFTIFQGIKCFNVAPAQLCVLMSDYACEIIYKLVVLQLWILVFIFENIIY